MHGDRSIPFRGNVATPEDWKKALNKFTSAVVVLKTTGCQAFDTEVASANYSTGFVVDKSRGVILTNRHVVKRGPVVAEAMFVNCEEILLHPIDKDMLEGDNGWERDSNLSEEMEGNERIHSEVAARGGIEAQGFVTRRGREENGVWFWSISIPPVMVMSDVVLIPLNRLVQKFNAYTPVFVVL
ncbi:hypothetical protein NE237_016699 [Protea cynaroides]|uniref:Uncharacterized protein n=1 Tax=Protea cynaroides TaxID=273540 RepID=A0A9Q0K6X1_9MAGN|nr:hypothetical protein NE237_016699 [Protea cynaroides]